MCCTFVGLDNKLLYKINGTYIKILPIVRLVVLAVF